MLSDVWKEPGMREQAPPISTFFHGKTVFITGASGFMGKVLVEKLLRSCPDVTSIYILLRSKKGIRTEERLENLLKAKLFERVKSEQPDAISKLVVIDGDLTRAGLGISEPDVHLIASNVSIVFHLGATVRFNEHLKRSVDMNVLGTRRLLQLCHKMKKLEAFIHVSTAYCNCDRTTVEEMIYDAPVSPKNLIDTIMWMDDDLIQVLTPHLIRGRPNTYTYTKAIAEALLVEESGRLPVAIVRPSIVTASWKEPFPGWIDNYNGLTGMIVATGKGILRSVYMNTSCTMDLIPVDIVINLLIAVAWYTASHRPQKMKVYNCTSGNINKIATGSITPQVLTFVRQHPSCEVFRYPDVSSTNSKIWNSISLLLHHHIPAYSMDFLSVVTRRKPKFVSLYKKLHRSLRGLQYFVTHEWAFSCDNVLMLHDKMSAEDQGEFNFNIKSLNWKAYMEDFILGVRQFLLKEDVESLSSARKNLRRMYLYTKMGHFIMMSGMCIIVFKLLRSSFLQLLVKFL